MDKREQFLKGMAAKVLEVESVTADSPLDPWDSLCIVMAIVLIDEVYGLSLIHI